MPLSEIEKTKLEKILQGGETFNNPFNNQIRDLDLAYCNKINLVRNGTLTPLCDGCTPPPVSGYPQDRDHKPTMESVADSRNKSSFPSCCNVDIKYLKVREMDTYADERNIEGMIRDLNTHPENEKLYKVIEPALFPPEEIIEVGAVQVIA